MRVRVSIPALESTATEVRRQAAAYRALYLRIASDARALRTAWAGPDNVAYADQVLGAEKYYLEMADLMATYAEALEYAASEYSALQQEMIGRAALLRDF